MNENARQLIRVDESFDKQALSLIASNIPDPAQYARKLISNKPRIARALKWAHKSSTGWRVHQEEILAPEMRSLGILEAVGSMGRHGQGYHLSAFGLGVLRALRDKAKGD